MSTEHESPADEDMVTITVPRRSLAAAIWCAEQYVLQRMQAEGVL